MLALKAARQPRAPAQLALGTSFVAVAVLVSILIAVAVVVIVVLQSGSWFGPWCGEAVGATCLEQRQDAVPACITLGGKVQGAGRTAACTTLAGWLAGWLALHPFVAQCDNRPPGGQEWAGHASAAACTTPPAMPLTSCIRL